jgi:hypothetical protein
MIEAARTSETSVDNYFTRQYLPEDKSELHGKIIVFFALIFSFLESMYDSILEPNSNKHFQNLFHTSEKQTSVSRS